MYVGKESSQVYDTAFVILVSSPPFFHPSGLNSQHLAQIWRGMGKRLQSYGPVFYSSTYCPFLSEQFLHYSRLFFDSGRLFVDGYAYDDFMVVPRGEGSYTTSTIHDLCQIGSECMFYAMLLQNSAAFKTELPLC